jgi:hypothetical protein
MRVALLLMLLVAGCKQGPDHDFEVSTVCEIDGMEFEFEPQADCNVAAHAVNEAKHMLIDRGFTTDDEFKSAFTGFPVVVRDADYLDCVNTTVGICTTFKIGRYNFGQHDKTYSEWIELERSGRGLVHEMLHRIDWMRGKDQSNESVAHAGWDSNGFFIADNDFRARRLPFLRR